MTKCAGWNLHLDRCPEFDNDGKAVFSINIVMPYCRENGQDVRATTQAALAEYPQFLFPHMWRGAAWRLYWNGGAGVPTGDAALTVRSDWPLAPAAAAAAAAAVADAVVARCRNSADTFSIGDEAFSSDPEGSSLAHALAHLTHWPAGLSDVVLGRACYLELDAADAARIPAGAQIAAFPSFRFEDGDGAVVQFQPAGFDTAGGPPRWSCGDAAYQLTCQLLPFTQPAAAAPAPSPAGVALTQSRLSTLDLRALVAAHLHPLALMQRSLAPFLSARDAIAAGRAPRFAAIIASIANGESIDAAARASLRDAFGVAELAEDADLAPLAAWAARLGTAGAAADGRPLGSVLQKALVQLAGCGWDRVQQGARDAAREPHLFELLRDWPSLYATAGSPPIPARIALGAAPGDGVVTAVQAKDLLKQVFDGNREASDDLALVFGDGPDAVPLFASWLRLAAQASEGSAGQDFTLRWLQRVDTAFFADGAAARKWEPVHDAVAALIRAGVNGRAWYERNAQGALDRLGGAGQADRLAFWADVQVLAKEAARAEQHEAATLAALRTKVTAALCAGLEAELGVAPPSPFIDVQVGNFVREIGERSSSSTSLQHEPGLGMVFDTGGGAADSAIRGYAIALRGGVPTGPGDASWDDERAQWITDTAFNLTPASKALLTLDSGQTAWMHETYGSTISNGQRVVAAEYAGLPLLSVPYREAGGGKAGIEPAVGKDRDFDDFAGIEFMWPDWNAAAERTALPLLGYGLCYEALATPIGNAGGVLAACRADGSFTRLRAARDVFPAGGPMVLFRSRQKVDAPDVRVFDATRRAGLRGPVRRLAEEADAYAMSGQTRAAAWLAARGIAARGGKPPMVALLTDDSDIWDDAYRARSYTLQVRPPRAGAAFLERWLNADVVAATLQTGAFTYPEFATARPEQIAAFRDLARMHDYHPAVAAIGVAVAFGDAAAPRRFVHEIHPLGAAGDSFTVDDAASTLTLTVRAAAAGETGGYDQGSATLVLEHAQFARVTLYSLVDREWIFDPAHPQTKPRFHALRDFEAFVPDSPAGRHYSACQGSEFVFEMAPAAPGTTAVPDDQLVLQGPDATRHATLSLYLRSTAGLSADWLHGAHFTPFDFHWTGYPIDFPSTGGNLQAWLLAHAHANTERPDLQGDVVFDTSFGSTPGEWFVGKRAGGTPPWIAGITERALRADVRPATHAAYTVQLRARFRAWLRQPAGGAQAPASASSPLSIEERPLAASAFLRGIAPDLLVQRLAVPVLRTAVPLTSTHWPGAGAGGGALPPRRQNGNMLVFDEAIRRTDDFATVGGVGEILELDVVAARDFGNVSRNKIGPNPIFHKAPAPGKPAGLTALAPFGLTYDQSDNGLVVQTGMIVVPEAGGEWLMAEVRTRRLVLPEVLMGTALLAMPRTGDEAGAKEFDIPLRQEGEDYVPLDFCIDVANGDSLDRLEFVKNGATKAEAVTLGVAPADAYRLLVSWHKGRFSAAKDGKPSWRMQVLSQVRVAGQLAWRVVGKLDCAETGVDWLQTNAGGRLRLLVPVTGKELKVSVVPMSDYTEGVWLHFIGNFAANPVEPDDFRLVRGPGNGLSLTAKPGRAPATPACIALSTADDNAVEFHWLLVYRPLHDVTRSAIESDAGMLLGAWRYDSGSHSFHPLDQANAAYDLAGCYAYLCTFQRNTALSHDEKIAIDNLEKGGTQALIECMFPDQSVHVTESTIRMVPKVLGQIAIA